MQDKASKCREHPGSDIVATCRGCGRDLCLVCAIPVRGEVFGTECLPDELRGVTPPEVVRGPRVHLPVAGAGFALAAVASLVSWKRYGLGSGLFGGWGITPRWSLLAGVAAALGLAVWVIVAVRRRTPGRNWPRTLRVLAALVIAGAALHLWHPPGFGPQSTGAWIALAGGVIALVGTLSALSTEPSPGR